MSLVKKAIMTEKKAAANRRNGNLSLGPVSPEGKARSGAARLRHGFYAKVEDAALRSFGEDPAELEELLAGLHEEFAPSSALQQRLVQRLAQVLMAMDRSHRAQEGQALRRAQQAGSGRENRLHARMMRLKMAAETLRTLARSVSCRHYMTTCEDWEMMKKLHHENLTDELSGITIDLFFQLQAPHPAEEEGGVSDEDKARTMMQTVNWVFGLTQTRPLTGQVATAEAPPTPQGQSAGPEVEGPPDEEDDDSGQDDEYPEISAEEWVARERARKLLRNILIRLAEDREAQRETLLKELLEGPSPYELAAEIAPDHAQAWLVRRTQDANLREVRRITSLLLRIKRQEHRQEETAAPLTAETYGERESGIGSRESPEPEQLRATPNLASEASPADGGAQGGARNASLGTHDVQETKTVSGENDIMSVATNH
jgi:hypothetical protein